MKPTPRDSSLPSGSGMMVPDAGYIPVAEQLRQVSGFVRRNLRWIGGAAAGAAILAGTYVVTTEPTYQASAYLMIEAPTSGPLSDRTLANVDQTEAYVAGQVFLLQSTDLLRQVVVAAALTEVPEFAPSKPGLLDRLMGNTTLAQPEDAALRKLRDRIQLTQDRNASVIKVTATSSSAALAAQLAETVARTYIETRMTARSERAAVTADWMTERALQLQAELVRAEAAIETYRADNNLIESRNGQTLSEQQLFDLNAELIRTRSLIAEQMAALEPAEAALAAGARLSDLPSVDRSQIVTALRTNQLELQRRLDDMVANTSGTPVTIAALQSELTNIQAQIDAESARIVSVMRAELVTLTAREAFLARSVAETIRDSSEEARSSIELRELERVAESFRTLYQDYLDNAGLAREGAANLAPDAELIGTPDVPRTPVAPAKKVILILGTLLGAGLGALAAYVRDSVRTGIQSTEQASRLLPVPVAATIPALPQGSDPERMIEDAPNSNFTEAIQVLRHSFPVAEAGKAPVIVLSSARAGEGKSGIAAALANAAFLAGQRVLLVDADLRRAGLTRTFGMDGEMGLTDFLANPRASAPFDGMGNDACLDIMPVGLTRSNPTDLIGSPAMTRFVVLARQAYDIVIIDGPPVANLADAPLLARLAGRVVFVASWNSTDRDAIVSAIGRLNALDRTHLVLNKVDMSAMTGYGEGTGTERRVGRKLRGGTPAA